MSSSKNPTSPSKALKSSIHIPESSIPERGSSKRAFSKVESDLNKARDDFDRKKKHLKPRTSFDSNYWETATEYAVMGRSVSKLELRKAVIAYVDSNQGSEDEFLKSNKGKALEEASKAWAVKENIYSKRAAELKTTDKERSLRRSFMQLFTSSPLGLDIKNAFAGRRNSSLQSNFRRDIIKDQGLRDPRGGQYVNHAWNIVTGKYERESGLVASHIFAWKIGQELMTAVFGSDAKDELFSSHNGLLLPDDIEAQFDNGMMSIVPNIKDLSSKVEVQLWTSSDPREYKFKIFDDNRESLDWNATTDASGQDVTFRQLDGRKLQFPSGSQGRPRARYLYFHYCCQILRQAWKAGANANSLPLMVKEHGMFAWGTVGKYLAHDHMRAFIEELGHEFEPLMANATQLDTPADRHTLVNALTDQILASSQEQEDEEDDDDDEEDDDDDDDDDDDE